MFRNKTHKREWLKLFETEHANALISDGFWYIICTVFKKGKQQSGGSPSKASAGGSMAGTNSQAVVLAMSSVD